MGILQITRFYAYLYDYADVIIQNVYPRVYEAIDLHVKSIHAKSKELVHSKDLSMPTKESLFLLLVMILILGTVLLAFNRERRVDIATSMPSVDPLDALSVFLLPEASIWPNSYLNLANDAQRHVRHSRTITLQIETLYQDLIHGTIQLRFPEYNMQRIVCGSIRVHGWTIKFVRGSSRVTGRTVGTLGMSPGLAKAIRKNIQVDGSLTATITTLNSSRLHKDDTIFAGFLYKDLSLDTILDILTYCESSSLEIMSLWNVSQTYATNLHAEARNLARKDKIAKEKVIMKHWEAGLYQAGILERFTISLRRRAHTN